LLGGCLRSGTGSACKNRAVWLDSGRNLGSFGFADFSGFQAVDVETQKNQADRNGDQKDDDLGEMFQKD